MYWTYENWPNEYARAHISDCGFCNDGKGFHRDSGSLNGVWNGPFESLEEALAASKYPVMECSICLNGQPAVARRVPRIVTPLNFDPKTFSSGVESFIESRAHDARYASFDYCFNYFQDARKNGVLDNLLDREQAELSCLQLGFYLASWGMFRGKAHIMQRSSHALLPVVETLITASPEMWALDAPDLVHHASEVVEFAEEIRNSFGPHASISDTLTTKILLGVFGTVPAFDQYFKKGFSVSTFSAGSLKKVGRFYDETREVVDSFEIKTLDFSTGGETSHTYTKSKIIDMGFFTTGLLGD